MSNLSNIGFCIESESEFFELAEKVYKIGQKIRVKNGSYVFYSDSSGAELWVQLDKNNSLIGMNPHFNGVSKRNVSITEEVKPLETILDGAFQCWADPTNQSEPESGYYPFVFDLPNSKAIKNIKFPFYTTIQLSAFTQEIEIFKNEDNFYSSQQDEPKFASQSFLPLGLFNNSEENQSGAYGMFAGFIKECELKQNTLTKNHFYHLLVDTLGGEVDVVLDNKLAITEPEKDDIIKGQFWLSGKLINERGSEKVEGALKKYFKKIFK